MTKAFFFDHNCMPGRHICFQYLLLLKADWWDLETQRQTSRIFER